MFSVTSCENTGWSWLVLVVDSFIRGNFSPYNAAWGLTVSTVKLKLQKKNILFWKLLRFNFLTATVVSPATPFNPLTTAFHTSPKEPLPRVCCKSTCFGATSQHVAETERYLGSHSPSQSSLKTKNYKQKKTRDLRFEDEDGRPRGGDLT